MLAIEELVDRTGGRSAQFNDPQRIPSMIAQFATALRAAYEFHLRVPATRTAITKWRSRSFCPRKILEYRSPFGEECASDQNDVRSLT